MQFPETYDFVEKLSWKAQALKVLEEAAELVEATKKDRCGFAILEEAMDTLQALANYLELLGYSFDDFQAAYDRVFLKNWKRGYYDGMNGTRLYDEAEQHYKELSQ